MTVRFLGVVTLAALLAGAAHAATLVVAPATGPLSLVKVVNGTGAVRSQFYTDPGPRIGGVTIADADGDGRNEIVVGGGADGRPDVVAFDARGDRVASYTAGNPAWAGGVTVAGLGAGSLVTGTDELAVRDAHGNRTWGTDARRAQFVAAAGSVVVAGDGSQTFEVFDARGTRTGTFSAGSPVTVAAGDVDGDGAVDVVTGRLGAEGPQVQVFDARTGKRIASLDPVAGAAGSVAVTVADLDGDRRGEIVAAAAVSEWTSALRAVHLDGTDAGLARSFWGPKVRLGSGDLNADGRAEVALAYGTDEWSSVDVHDAAGTVVSSVTPFAWHSGSSVAIADVDRDGNLDVVAGSAPGARPQVRIFDLGGNLRRAFDAYDPVFRYGVQVAAADVDDDGFADVVAAAAGGGLPTVRAFDGRTGRQLVAFDAFQAGTWISFGIAAGDLWADGTADVLVAPQWGSPLVKVFDAAGAQQASLFAFDESSSSGVSIASGEILGDGFGSIIAWSPLRAQVRVLRVDGSQLAAFDVPGGHAAPVAAADVDGDGRDEVLLSSGIDGRVDAYRRDGTLASSFAAFPGRTEIAYVAAPPRIHHVVRKPVPPTRPDVRGPRWTRSKTPAYRFSSRDLDGSDAAIRYRCAFDSTRLRACRARVVARLRPGKHVLRVRAVDEDGLASAIAVVRIVVAR